MNLPDIQIHTGQSGEDIVLQRIFHGKKNGFYVDIGSFNPVKYSNTFLLHELFGWRGINIDASSKAIELFNEVRPDDINIHTAIADEEQKEMKLYKFDRPARNTLSEDNLKRQIDKGGAEVIGEEIVTANRLDYILSKHMPEGTNIDLMNVDIEGFDIDALKTNDWNRFRPSVILVEDYSIDLASSEKSEIYNFLSSKSYKLQSHCFDTSIYTQL